MRVTRAGDGAIVAKFCESAHTSMQRMKGLLGRTKLEAGAGLWILPCNSVHTWFMKFPIDVIFLDANKKIVRTEENLRPWRITRIVLKARSVLEIESGTVSRFGLIAGDQLNFGE